MNGANIRRRVAARRRARDVAALLRGRQLDEEPRVRRTCTLGVGCDEAGVCFAEAHGEPDRCGRTE